MPLSGKSEAERSPMEATLLHAKLMAADAGISEVAEITNLDCMGVPVFVSVRPRSRADIYTYGKGLSRLAAEVGAYMEALEFSFAEPCRAAVPTHWGTPREVAGSDRAADAVLDYPPLLQREADLDARMLLAVVRDLETGAACAVPAELVFYPPPEVGLSLYGASTNGMACGDSLAGATIHGLLELVERDIWSFELVRRGSRLVDPSTLPETVREIADRADRAGLALRVRTIQNDYGLPFFAAFLFDAHEPRLSNFNGGWACDLERTAAAVRAVTEAAQSRLAFIHGGRKLRPVSMIGGASGSPGSEAAVVRRHIAGVSGARGQVDFTDIPGVSVPDCLSERLREVVGRIRQVTDKPIYRAVFTPSDALLHVVRMVVPLLENFRITRARVGRRLKAALDACPAQAV